MTSPSRPSRPARPVDPQGPDRLGRAPHPPFRVRRSTGHRRAWTVIPVVALIGAAAALPAAALPAVALLAAAPRATASGPVRLLSPDPSASARRPAAPVITSPAAGAVQSSLFDVRGTGLPGARVTVVLDDLDDVLGLDTVTRTVYVLADGTWAVDQAGDEPLPPGVWRVSATQAAGSPPSAAAHRLTTVGPTAGSPAAPRIATPTSSSRLDGLAPHLYARGTGTPGDTLVLRIRVTAVLGPAALRLTFYLDGGVVPRTGRWTADLNANLIGLTLADSAAAAAAAGRPTASAGRPTASAGRPTASPEQPASRGPAAPHSLAVLLARAAGRTPVETERVGLTAYQSDGVGRVSAFARAAAPTVVTRLLPAPRITAPGPHARVHGPVVTVGGTGLRGATVDVRASVPGLGFFKELGEARVGKGGRWAITVRDLPVGTTRLVADQLSRSFQPSVTSPVRTFTVLRPLPATPVIAGPGRTADATPTICGTGVDGGRLHLFDSGRLVGAATVTRRGTWCVTTRPLRPGRHLLTATEKVASGTSRPSSVLVLHVG